MTLQPIPSFMLMILPSWKLLVILSGAVEAPQKSGGGAQSKKGTDAKGHLPFKKGAHRPFVQKNRNMSETLGAIIILKE